MNNWAFLGMMAFTVAGLFVYDLVLDWYVRVMKRKKGRKEVKHGKD